VEPALSDYLALLKPRVMRLSVFTAIVGMAAAPVMPHPVIAITALLCVAIGAGASGALNMWWDADIDRKMARTKGRPIPLGRVAEGEALAIGIGLSVLSVVLLSVIANPLSGALLAGVIAFYIVVYTMWLKRRTPLNIVIGGAAGAAPPMIGWAIATGEIGFAPLLLFALIFFWTPPHSWALALFRRQDYTTVGVPMLPVTAGEEESRRHIWLYSLVLMPVSLTPVLTDIAGPVYLIVGLLLNSKFLMDAYRIKCRSQAAAIADNYLTEKRFFGWSIAYIFVFFLALLVEVALRGFGVYG
jgi:protoheme IX farnesyltransferase